MPFPWMAAASFAAPIVGGLFSKFGAEDQNVASAKAAQAQMDFQERMSNTQYQRSMADMRKAGLNPILAYKQGGAGTPGGSTYSPVNVGAAAVQGASAGFSSALANKRYKLEEALAAENLSKIQSEAWKAQTSAGVDQQTKENLKAQARLLRQEYEIRKPDVSSAKHADELYAGPFGSFFKWWKMLFKGDKR